MLGIERTGFNLDQPRVRQVFVTQSRVLAERVEEYFFKLIQTSNMKNKTGPELAGLSARKIEIEKELVELDEEDESRSRLPARFSELQDEHFPLFLTFDQVF